MKHGLLCVVLLTLIAGCDAFSSEPTYGGLSVEGFNYTPYNLDRFVITDKYGNRAGGGGDLMPGSGEGRLSCCYKLKGTDFTVKWDVYDQDKAMINPYAPIDMIHKVTEVHLPPTKVPGGAGERILGLHFYPDDHIEFEFRRDLSGTRIEYDEIWGWLDRTYGKQINPKGLDDAVVFRQTARIAAGGWMKYRLTDKRDLRWYVYYAMVVNSRFDEHPAVQKILAETKDNPGAFGAAMEKLPAAIVTELKSDKFEHVPTGVAHG
ncbi:hypothetical protein AYM40_20670 [Paraburkholderia phytofirmans OLGA172]|uniref:DUF3304 domain-containing protein n=1 Tax=Paraburkholderia phytofirmans OLGA172 TaxID=1417228 RepID=A0A160FPU9_9BURK|nr:DUF3304 domain-containing protein [Paraburkholderia phytofirmans]ANB74870.1 hypothetical protein AYM40_20670 [Paraburkholderia phytofirmans OLGA172]